MLHHAKIRITGIDVQAELRAKGGSPNLGPTRMPVSTAPLSQPIQRYAVNKYAQNRRSLNNVPNSGSPAHTVAISPNIRPQPTSGISSPIISAHHRSPNFLPQQNGPMSPAFAANGQQIRPQPQQIRPQFQPPARPSVATYPSSASTINSATSAPSSAGYAPNQPGPNANGLYNTPFQSHYDQLGGSCGCKLRLAKANTRHQSKSTTKAMETKCTTMTPKIILPALGPTRTTSQYLDTMDCLSSIHQAMYNTWRRTEHMHLCSSNKLHSNMQMSPHSLVHSR